MTVICRALKWWSIALSNLSTCLSKYWFADYGKLSNLHPKNIFFAHIIGRCGFLPTWGFHSKPGSGDVTRCPFDKKYCNYFRISQDYYSVQMFVSAVKFINLIKYRFCLAWNIFLKERGKLYRYTSVSVSPWKKRQQSKFSNYYWYEEFHTHRVLHVCILVTF